MSSKAIKRTILTCRCAGTIMWQEEEVKAGAASVQCYCSDCGALYKPEIIKKTINELTGK